MLKRRYKNLNERPFERGFYFITSVLIFFGGEKKQKKSGSNGHFYFIEKSIISNLHYCLKGE